LSRSTGKKEWQRLKKWIDELRDQDINKIGKIKIAQIKGLKYCLAGLEANDEVLLSEFQDLESRVSELEDRINVSTSIS